MLRLKTALHSAFVLAALFAPGFSSALQLSLNLPAIEVSNPPTVVRFLIFDSAEVALPIGVYDFPAGQYQLSLKADRVWIKAELVDELEPGPLWVELELDGAPRGERIPLATVTSGVTFAVGNNLNMDGNAILNLAYPGSDPNDAATKGYVDSASISGNAATATALATNGTNCSSGEYARGVDENGNAEDCTTDQVGTGDNLGNHTATANIQLGSHWISGDGGSEGIQVAADGKVGIGSAPGSADLQIGGTDGVLFQGTVFSGSIPTEGSGTRFMWYPRKAALRAGRADSDEWDDINIGYDSTAMGLQTTASAAGSTAMGTRTTASGGFSTAMGEGTIASGSSSTAMGWSTTASGGSSTAMGFRTIASGSSSTAMGGGSTGGYTTASGSRSTAMGEDTTASGYASTAMGISTTAKSFSETVIGQFNTDYNPASTESWDPGDRLFVIGNGSDSNNPSDALRVYKHGLVVVPGNLIVGTLGAGGDPVCHFGGLLSQCSSSSRYKEQIRDLPLGLDEVLRLRPVSFMWKERQESDLGFVAEEVASIDTSLTTYNDKGEIEGVKYRQLTAVLVNAVQQQQEQMENLKAIVCTDHPEAEMCQ